MERIFLVGYMGSGKTTIGTMLAEQLGYLFVDVDVYIEKHLSKSVSQIFTEIGEAEFRQLEKQCLRKVANFDRVIISTGGGAPCFFDNMTFMNAHGLTVYLKFTSTELAERLENSDLNQRPLLKARKGEDLRQFISDGLEQREPFYAQAALSITGTKEEIITKICEYIHPQ